ncbi:MAG: hypothetical protein ABIW36_06730 [Terrimesophilobacter sp.]
MREHDLRGFVASGANAFEDRDFLGHANVRTTEALYIRKVNNRVAQLADAMPQLPAARAPKLTQITTAKLRG